MKEVGDNVYQISLPTPFPIGDVHVYLLRGAVPTLIDVGPNTDEAEAVLERELQQVGLSIATIPQVILTHHHADHAGLLNRFPASTVVYGHADGERWLLRSEEFLTNHDAFFEGFVKQAGMDDIPTKWLQKFRQTLRVSCDRPLDQYLVEGDTLPYFPDWEVVLTPGHATGHITLVHQPTRVALGGDVLLSHISSNPLVEPPFTVGAPRHKPILEYNDSLRKLQSMSLTTVWSGHGDVINEPTELITTRLRKQHKRALDVFAYLKSSEEEQTLYTICQWLFPAAYKRELGLALSETLAQLDYLQEERWIGSTIGTNGWEYFYCREGVVIE